MNVYPFEEVLANAERLVERGSLVFFQFKCAGCGAKNTFEEVNTVYPEGRCEDCKHVTDLRLHGMNFALVQLATKK